MKSEQRSCPTGEPVEPLKSIPDVLGWQAPEVFPDETEEEAAVKADAEASRTPYEVWAADKSKENLFTVVKGLQPTIGSVLASIGGTSPDIRSKARVIAAKAVQTYKPESGASLATWVSQNLRQLTRDVRKSNSDIRIPEGVQLDAYNIYKAETELEDELGREPTVEEVADRSHLSVRRIAEVRRKNRKTGTEGGAEADDGTSMLVGGTTDHSQEAMDYIYRESDMNDRKLMEYTVGYGGHEQLPTAEIKKRLKLNDTQLSRRKMRLAMRIREVMNTLEEL